MLDVDVDLQATGVLDALKARSCCVGQFFRSGNQPNSVQGLGSFFLLKYGDKMLLATAGHVATTVHDERIPVTIRLLDKAFQFVRVPFAIEEKLDVAFADVNSMPSLKRFIEQYIEADCIPDYTDSLAEARLSGEPERVGLLGFPGSKNKLDDYDTTTNPQLLCITADRIVRPSDSTSRVSFAFSRKKTKAPYPNGMSGGAVFRVAFDHNKQAYVTLIKAIIIEHVDGQCLTAVPLTGALV
ncbi:hypothetical protein V3I01_18455 (plasmid) [Sphingomonas sp. gentR]|uniref:hypothetical protein n=1 Tax=Sphingomonas sp. gentR TaxID=3118768 RepID=UPI0030D08389